MNLYPQNPSVLPTLTFFHLSSTRHNIERDEDEVFGFSDGFHCDSSLLTEVYITNSNPAFGRQPCSGRCEGYPLGVHELNFRDLCGRCDGLRPPK